MVNWEDGILVSSAKVNEDGTITPAVYSGNTPLSAYNLNKMQSDLQGETNEKVNNLKPNKYILSITENTETGAEITIPCYYKVGQDVLDVYIEDERLIKSSDEAGTDGHYQEVGELDSISNKIKITTDWAVEAGMIFEFVVRGEYSNDTE